MPALFEPREVTLRDGRKVTLRSILPSDEQEILQAFEHVNAESRYMRFMAAVKHLDERRVHTILGSFPEKGFAVVATVPADDGIDIVGAASYVLENERSCEFAMTVVDGWGGAGLGRELLAGLMGVACARGMKQMRGFVLSSNQAMLALSRRLGFKVAHNPDFSTRVVTLELA
jgi:acetyltransferase